MNRNNLFKQLQGTLIRALIVVAFVAGPGLAQPRGCLDIDGNGVVDLADVELAQLSLGGRDAAVDPRADFDLRGGVDVHDLTSQVLVAEGQLPAILGFDSPSVAAGDRVSALVQNVKTIKNLRVVVRTSSESFDAEDLSFDGEKLSFIMPDVGDTGILDLEGIDQALPGADLDGLVLVELVNGKEASNLCPVLVLRGGEKDTDADGIVNAKDTCPFDFDPQNGDTDFDGLGDLCDNCPATPNVDQLDSNADGSGDACAPPTFAVINGVQVEAEGVDDEFKKAEKAHAVLVLTREIDDKISQELGDMGIEIDRPLARHAFLVAAREPGFADLLPGFVWFRGLFSLTGDIRAIGELRGFKPRGDEDLLLDVEIQKSVTLAEAETLLLGVGATIEAKGVDLLSQGAINLVQEKAFLLRRINQWRIRLHPSRLSTLLGRSEVISVQLGRRNTTQSSATQSGTTQSSTTQSSTTQSSTTPGAKNANSRNAINVDPLNTAGLNGSGVTLGEWDGGWAAGDNTFPPNPPAGGLNGALSPRVMVRDHNGGDEGIAYPFGCSAANVSCTGGFCSFGNHATHVGGTMIGDGSLWIGGTGINAGMAPQGNLESYEWSDNSAEVACERQDAITNFNTVAHNNSWGYCPSCALMGLYENRSVTYDREIRANPAATEFFAAANYQYYRNNLFNPCTNSFDPSCALPPIFNSPACTTPPPGVTIPSIAIPPTSTLNRFYTVSPPGGTAKNTVAVGNIDFLNNRLSNSSSMGPTRDGRLKPEVVAHGTSVTSTCVPGLFDGLTCNSTEYLTISGTSMATPSVTGATGLLYERASQVGVTLNNASAKALLTHTADDLGVHGGAGGALSAVGGAPTSQWQAFAADDGPDYLTGYGLVDAQAARTHIDNGNISGVLKPTGCPTGVTYASIPFDSPVDVAGPGPVAGCPAMVWDVVWYITVPPGMSELKVTIAWNDVEATAGANPTLVNDIDLMVKEPSGTYHYPWWLDPACPYLPASRVQTTAFNNAVYGDHRNNVEQVHVVGGLAPGQWRIVIRTDGLGVGPQPFSMMVSMN